MVYVWVVNASAGITSAVQDVNINLNKTTGTSDAGDALTTTRFHVSWVQMVGTSSCLCQVTFTSDTMCFNIRMGCYNAKIVTNKHYID